MTKHLVVWVSRGSAPTWGGALTSMAQMLAMWPAPNEREVVLRALIAQLGCDREEQRRLRSSRIGAVRPRVTRRRWPQSREARVFWTRVHLSGTRIQNDCCDQDAVDRGPEGGVRSALHVGRREGVPCGGTSDDASSIRSWGDVRQCAEELSHTAISRTAKAGCTPFAVDR